MYPLIQDVSKICSYSCNVKNTKWTSILSWYCGLASNYGHRQTDRQTDIRDFNFKLKITVHIFSMIIELNAFNILKALTNIIKNISGKNSPKKPLSSYDVQLCAKCTNRQTDRQTDTLDFFTLALCNCLSLSLVCVGCVGWGFDCRLRGLWTFLRYLWQYKSNYFIFWVKKKSDSLNTNGAFRNNTEDLETLW